MRRIPILSMVSMLCLLVFSVATTRFEASAATYREPAFDIPHIHANTDVDLFFEYGQEAVKDRLGQFVLLARFARGTAAGLFGAGSLGSDIGSRSLAYSSSELNDMFAKLPAQSQAGFDAYIAGVNTGINAVLAGGPGGWPVEVGTAVVLGQGDNLFGNKNNISDQVDPGYSPVTQFTRELSTAITILQSRNFGSSSGFGNEFNNFENLLRLQAKFGPADGFAIFNDLHFLNDPLSPVSVPDPTTPGFGGPLSAWLPDSLLQPIETLFAWFGERSASLRSAIASLASTATSGSSESADAIATRLDPVPLTEKLPHYAYADTMEELRGQAEAREQHMREMAAWPMIGSYTWAIDGARGKSGDPWLGGFPQTGVQTPSIMHAVELSSNEGTNAIGMAFVGGPSVLIGHTRDVA